MDPQYRRTLALQEILGYHADIICLQEVDEKAFSHYLLPHLQFAGFEGHYTNKAGKAAEGSATFFRRSRYRLVTRRDIVMRDLFPEGGESRARGGGTGQAASLGSCPEGLREVLPACPSLAAALQRVSTICQITVLEPVPGGPGQEAQADAGLCVVNTHLFFHPNAPHIRTIHTAAMLAEAHALLQELGPPGQAPGPALLFCGDLNSDLNDGVPGTLELLAKGRVPATFWDWGYGRLFSFRKNEDEAEAEASADGVAANGAKLPENGDAFPGLELSIPFALASADNLETDFTNYVRGYKGCLDYVWYEPERMKVTRAIPLPAEEEVNGWIPSPRFPSDHLAVVFDMEWLPTAIPANNSAGSSPLAQDLPDGTAGSPSRMRGQALPALHLEEAGAPSHERSAERPLCEQAVLDGAGSGQAEVRRPANVEPILATSAAVAEAAAALASGGVIALPTDTLYGLAACAEDTKAVRDIYSIKGRDLKVPLAICVGEPADVARYAAVEHLPEGLLEALLPGPVTLLLPRLASPPLSPHLNPGVSAIGVRVPDHDFIRQVCRQHGGAIALTSANPSGAPSCLSVSEFRHLWPRCAAVFDGGTIQGSRQGSTILDLTQQGLFAIKRRGTGCDRVAHLLTTVFGLHEYMLDTAQGQKL